MKAVFLFFTIFFSLNMFAATIESIKNGDWSDPTTWSTGTVPKTNDVVTINHNINLDVSLSAKISIQVNEGFSLTSNTKDLETKSGAYLYVYGTVIAYDLTFDNGSEVRIHSTGSVTVRRNFKNKNNSTDVVVDGLLNVENDFDNGMGGIMTGSGQICTTGSYIGAGTTFGRIPTSSIPRGSCIKMLVLPVELISFVTEKIDDNVKISWSTASEKNNSHFEIYRSTDGIDFKSIAIISGAGNSNQVLSYEYTDVEIPKSTVYYMLKQVDFNGDFEVFDMLSVNNEISEENCDMNINPNPCIGRCKIVFKDCFNEENKDAKFMVYDASGRVVYLSINKPISQGEASFSFDVGNNLKPAVYIVRGAASEKVIDKKTVMQKNE